MPNLDWNRQVWADAATWAGGGEEWSIAWGTSEAQWFGSLYPRLHRLLPARCILEIAPGYGRWTRFLLPQCERYVGMDLSPLAVAACRERFAAVPHASFLQNDGISLADVGDDSVDLVFSFDSLVHCEMEVLASYLPQIIRKLTPSGVAFLHHSNMFEVTGDEHAPPSSHHRAASVSADRVAGIIGDNRGTVLLQEKINWGGATLDDCITVFGHADYLGAPEALIVLNPEFMGEAGLVKRFQSGYSSHLAQSLHTGAR